MILSYARVSTVEQAADGTTSIAEQIRKNKAIADLRGASSFDCTSYVDEGVSGSIPLSERPKGKAMLADAAKGDIIVASKMDRLFRSASDALNTAESLKARGVDLILVDMGTNPVTENGTAKMFFGMLALVAEFERGRIAERMEDGRRGKRQRSGHLGGVAPYGYRVVGEKRESRLEPVPEEQPILQEVLDLSKQKLSSWTIMKQINEKGYKNREGKPFECYQVKRIIDRADVTREAK
jgi:DNA invertase Pin-like site-specific DNA recombinase